ncbi:MAG: acyloxyacyl hydrolase [Verrucomicrobia bacterium]|nr:acyloxyacyl hydrolase [Verrucomicrobiota bacterium]MDA1086425.1 acyloxyacyl hydrolase [Verrucomicrobiota bacterium]
MLKRSRGWNRTCLAILVAAWGSCVGSLLAQNTESTEESTQDSLWRSFLGSSAVGLELAKGSSEIESVKVFVQSHWSRAWLDEGRWLLTGYWEIDYARWETARPPKEPDVGPFDSTELIGFSPVFRLVQKRIFSRQTKAYLEGSVGVHYLQDTMIGDRNVSSNFQFGDHLGLGVIFGRNSQFDLSYRLQHFSNGGVESPNPGLDFHAFRLAMYF